jgi:hypothetical protein
MKTNKRKQTPRTKTKPVGDDVRSPSRKSKNSRLVTSSPTKGKRKLASAASADDVQSVKDAIASIRQTLGVLVSITPKDIQHTFKLGDSRWPAAQLALQTAQDNPAIMPPGFDLAGFQSTMDLFDELTELQTVADQLDSDLSDTHIAVGGKAMQYTLQVKKLVDASLKTAPGMKPIADKLAAYFAHASPTPPPAPAN